MGEGFDQIHRWTEADENQLNEIIRIEEVEKLLEKVGRLNPAYISLDDVEYLKQLVAKCNK